MSDTLADRLDGWAGELSNSTDWPTKKRLELVEDLIPAAAQLRAMDALTVENETLKMDLDGVQWPLKNSIMVLTLERDDARLENLRLATDRMDELRQAYDLGVRGIEYRDPYWPFS